MAGNFDWTKILGVLGGTGAAGAVSQMNPVTAGLAAVPALYQLGTGIAQDIQAAKAAKSQVRPTLTTPAAQLQALYNAQNMADGQAPGISLARQLMGQNQAASTAAVQNTGGGVVEKLANLQLLDQNAGTQAMQLGQQQEQYANAARMNLQDQLMKLEQAQQEQFMYNRDEPYRNAMALSKELDNASAQNIQGGLTGLGGAVASAVGPMGRELKPSVVDSMDQRKVSLMPSTLGVNQRSQGIPAPETAATTPLSGLVKSSGDLPQRTLDFSALTGDGEITFPPGMGSSVNANTFGGAAGNIARQLQSIDDRIRKGEDLYKNYNNRYGY